MSPHAATESAIAACRTAEAAVLAALADYTLAARALGAARRHGLVPLLLSADIARLGAARPGLIADDAALAAALRGLGYSEGEVAARLMLSPAPLPSTSPPPTPAPPPSPPPSPTSLKEIRTC